MASLQFLKGILLIVLAAVLFFFIASQSTITKRIPFGSSDLYTFLARSGFDPDLAFHPPTSTLAGKVLIDFVLLGNERTDNDTYLVLRSSAPQDEYIDVTGWKIRTSRGDHLIPKARDFNTAKGMEGDIFLRGGTSVFVYGGKGKNLRIADTEWRVWVREDFLVFPHDEVLLLDRDGGVVDRYSY